MSGWIVPVVYAVGWLFGYRIAYGFFANDDLFMDPKDPFDRVAGTVMAALLALFWPIGIPIALLHRFARPTTRREREALLQQRQAELDERERRVRQLERELGIGGNS